MLRIIIFLLFLLARRSSKKSKAPSFQIRSRWFLTGMFFKQIRVALNDGVPFLCDVIRSIWWRPWRHFSYPSVARCWICSSIRCLAASRPSACDVSSWSIVHSYLLLPFSRRQVFIIFYFFTQPTSWFIWTSSMLITYYKQRSISWGDMGAKVQCSAVISLGGPLKCQLPSQLTRFG